MFVFVPLEMFSFTKIPRHRRSAEGFDIDILGTYGNRTSMLIQPTTLISDLNVISEAL